VRLLRHLKNRHVYRVASYQEERGLSLVYVYVRPLSKWPEQGYLKNQIRSEARDTEVVIDYDAEGNMLGIEVIVKTEPEAR
jgi:uncharacterized protein YuzE